MIIIEFNGGLGNQMFQYGLYKRLLKEKKNVKAYIANDENGNRPFRLNIFPNVSYDLVDYEIYNRIKSIYINRGIVEKVVNRIIPNTRKVYRENENKRIDRNILKINDCIISGYFQGLEYLKPVERELRNDYEFPLGETKLTNTLELLPPNGVSVHIRRGDYLKYPHIYGGICTTEYYRKAIKFFEDKGLHNFVVFSDDIEWVKNNLDIGNAIYIEESMFDNYQDWYDMFIMSKCSHNIIANSTFSWWGAWLNSSKDRMVVCPPYFEKLHKNKDLICDDWNIITG